MYQKLVEEISEDIPLDYGNPNYIYRPRPGNEIRDRDCMNRIQERPNNIERDRIECNGQGNRYLTPLNNLQEGIHEQDISRSPLSPETKR